MKTLTQEQIDWLNSNCQGQWCFSIPWIRKAGWHYVGNIEFAVEEDALLFKLTF